MLTAPAVLAIVNAVREDLMAYISELVADQHFRDTVLRSSFNALLAQVTEILLPGE
jgi:hypothetical protein